MCLKHSKQYADLIFSVFFRMPFGDRLGTSILQVLDGFWVHFGTLRTSFWTSAGNFSGIYVLLDFCQNFVKFGCLLGDQGGADLTVEGSPRACV